MGKVHFREGGNHPAGRPVADVTRFTPGKYVPLAQSPLRGDGVRMLTASGEKAQFIFNDNVKVTDDMAVGLMTRYSGADAIRVLAGDAVAAETEIVFHISETDDLPKAVAIADAEAGDWVCGRTNFGNFSTGEDVADSNGDYDPSLTIFLYDEGVMRQVGAEESASIDTFTFDIELPLLANGDAITDWTPGFAGEFVSHAFRVTEAVTTADKAGNINIEIDGVNVTGGVISLTSANATPAGKVINGTPITALNSFDADSVISWEGSGVTTFVEGSGQLIITVRHTAA